MIKDSYDIIVAGSGLGGMTAARRLAGGERRILLVEQHSQLGGLATYFKRRGHIFDVALHGFPVGMQKSLRKYWGKEFAQRVSQVRSIRFNNPQYQLDTTFDTEDFSAKLHGHFGVPKAAVDAFFAAIAEMNYYDQNQESTREFFQRHFPGRKDIWRFLMEPITYANGSTLDEPAISYGIVFGNFMSKGVYTFTGGTDCLIDMMEKSLREHGVQVECNAALEKIYVEGGRVRAARINGKEVGCRALVSNGSLPRTVLEWVGEEHFREEFSAGLKQLVLSNSSCQVYIGIKEGEKLPYIGDLLFDSTWPEFDSEALLSRQVSSRTYSVYYPEIRPGSSAYSVVASMNARHEDWAGLSREEYRASKKALIEDSLDALSLHLPNIRRIADYVEAATPCTFERYTGHVRGATFGSKFPGLGYSMGLHQELGGLFHTGSVGIIMSGWLGAANYGVITANEVEKYLAAAAG
ncbi:MAG: FAD-dependent oxidoreductase [Lentisphaeria bacterium]|nr:FAD-dependent oxidoreductase [Lentisphaeria bacterium]MDY0176907.1 FAD-dependent oxidoreductase [Lentisphaeria bacterium]